MSSPQQFPAFPFKPYEIQVQFMSALYQALQKGGVAVMESPTGTGKTLSLICSTLQWLIDREDEPPPIFSDNGNGKENDDVDDDDEPDWMRDFDAERKAKQCTPKKKIKRYIAKKPSRDFLQNGQESEGLDVSKAPRDEDSELLLDDYESGDEKMEKGSCTSDDDEEEEEDEEEKEEGLKVYFCSRTHSQLSQFVKELRRTPFASSLSVVCLGSRKTFCINPGVSKLVNRDRINDRCLELQKNKSSTTSNKNSGDTSKKKKNPGCPMLRKEKLQQFKEEVSKQDALDVEDLLSIGHKLGACPYYGSRALLALARIVVLPYQSLLLKSARENLGIKLKASIIIIDEAHNLVDSIIDMHNSQISVAQLQLVTCHLKGYAERFKNRLGAGNRRYIQMLMVVIEALLHCLLPCEKDIKSKVDEKGTFDDVVMNINEFLFLLDIDNINLVKLLRFVTESNIIHKVNGYGEKYYNEDSVSGSSNSLESNIVCRNNTVSSFRALAGFLRALTNDETDGKVILSKKNPGSHNEKSEGYLKYTMLNAEKIFANIMEEAHTVVLAGGTLQPIEEMKEQLFPHLPQDKLHIFSCGHIVPPDSILPIAISHGPTGKAFNFTYESRSSPFMIEELGRLLCNISSVIPEGIVVFLASFEYKDLVYSRWRETGILDILARKKHVFLEPRSNATIEATLQEYKAAVLSKEKGALLLAVVGGKISEGINFSDGMGRCVVMVGLPYPNLSNPELVERIKYIDKLGANTGESTEKPCKDSTLQSRFSILRCCNRRGREYYENLCMKAVNQSIGRAIRHIGDYAAILLVDARYASIQESATFKSTLSNPTSKLPKWISEHLLVKDSFGSVQKLLCEFFKYHQNK